MKTEEDATLSSYAPSVSIKEESLLRKRKTQATQIFLDKRSPGPRVK